MPAVVSVRARNVRAVYTLLGEIADRARDPSPAWDEVADDVFEFERAWWQRTYGGKRDKAPRRGRNPRLMRETGDLERAATQRGARRQRIKIDPEYLLIEVTDGLAPVHERYGREVLGEPTRREAGRWARKVARYILIGRT